MTTRIDTGDRYRHRDTGLVAEVKSVDNTLVFGTWETGINFSMSPSQFLRVFTYHVPRKLSDLATFRTDEYEGIDIGRVYIHKNDGRCAKVANFYEKLGVVFVTYLWLDNHEQGARPVQSFKDTFHGFQWNEYEHYIRPGRRYVDKNTNECVTVLHIVENGSKVKIEYIKKAVKTTVPASTFFDTFRPYAGLLLYKDDVEQHSEDETEKPGYLAVFIDVNSCRVVELLHRQEADTLLKSLDARIPVLLNKGLRIVILNLTYDSVIHEDYIEVWQGKKPSDEEILKFVREFSESSRVTDGKNEVISAVINWKPIALVGKYISLIKYLKTLPENHWVHRLVKVEREKR